MSEIPRKNWRYYARVAWWKVTGQRLTACESHDRDGFVVRWTKRSGT